MNSISLENIKNLKGNAKGLTELLLKLLFSEHRKYNFPDCLISVPQNINTADGGEDGRIETSNSKNSVFVKDNLCLFQCKASDMTPSECKDEILTRKGVLKTQVNEIFNKNGTYILITTQSLVHKDLDQKSKRIKKIREAIYEAKLIEGLSPEESKKYSISRKLEIYDANKIKDWTNNFISVVCYVQSISGITKPNGLITWYEFKTYPFNEIEFISNDYLDGLIESLRNTIYEGKNIRLEGVSGIGKSRLICEVLSPGKIDTNGEYNLIQSTNSHNTIYFDISTNYQELLKFIRSHVLNLQAILVLDNCPPNIHKQFLTECNRNGSKVQLVSIDFERLDQNISVDGPIFEINQENYKNITEKILKSKYNGVLSDIEIKKLIEFSEGNTKMAIDFARASLRKLNLNQTFGEELVRKLIFGRSPEKEFEYEVLKKVAIFKTFNYPIDDLFTIDKMKFESLRSASKFICDYFSFELSEFDKVIKKFIKSGLIERRGNLIMIRPNALSLKLSIIFWDELGVTNYEAFLVEMPEEMRVNLCSQLENLGNVSQAKQLVKSLWGVDGNFSTAEILNSNIGSRLFRSVVTVNPIETTKALVKNFFNKTKAELIEVKEGRMNLVWALERLCFRKETFYDASRLLMEFAIAENEHYYSNNATSYFRQLFKLYLAGTEVHYKDRIKVLQWALKRKNRDYNFLIINVCSTALSNNRGNYRTVGSEYQGGSLPLKDFQPTEPKEIHDYFKDILNILEIFMNSSDIEFRKESYKVVYKNLNTLFKYNYNFDKIKSLLNISIDEFGMKKDFLKALQSATRFGNLNSNEKNQLFELIKKFAPKTIPERIKYYVSEPEYDFSLGEDIDINDRYKQNATKLAEELIEENVDLTNHFDSLFLGYQYHSYDFGKSYGKKRGWDLDFLISILSFLKTIEDSEWNLSFLSGYLSVQQKDKKETAFDFFIKNKSKFSFIIYNLIEPSLKKSLRLIELLNNPNDLKYLKHIDFEINRLSSKDLKIFLEKLATIDGTLGYIISILYYNIDKKKNEKTANNAPILDFIQKLIHKDNLLNHTIPGYSADLYKWETVMSYTLDNRKEISKLIARQIVDYFEKNFPNSRGDYHVANIANKTLDVDFENSWKEYSDLLLKNGFFLIFSEIFDTNWVLGAENTNPFFVNFKRNKKIFNWCKSNPEAAKTLIRIAPLFDGQNWFGFTKDMIDEFGNDDNFITELSCNFHSMTTSGSRVPTLKHRKVLATKLIDNKNNKVDKWARSEIISLEKEIKIEQINDEEYNYRF